MMDDVISRQATIDAVDESLTRVFVEHRDIAEKMINKIPSAQPEIMKWIPCSERLPEGKQEVLVTEYGDTDMGRRFDGRWVDRYGDKMKDVTAWMPLPEPYREGEG